MSNVANPYVAYLYMPNWRIVMDNASFRKAVSLAMESYMHDAQDVDEDVHWQEGKIDCEACALVDFATYIMQLDTDDMELILDNLDVVDAPVQF